MATLLLTLSSSPSSLWWKRNCCHPPPTVNSWPDTLWLLLITKTEIKAESTPVWYHWRPNRRECLTLWHKRTYRKRSKDGGDGGTGVYVPEGTTSRVLAANKPYSEFFFISTASVRNILDRPSYSTMFVDISNESTKLSSLLWIH
jgi:hypothetical protein